MQVETKFPFPPSRTNCLNCGDTYFDTAPGNCNACRSAAQWIQLQQSNARVTLTPDELYQLGYDDAKAGKSANASHVHDENYEMGFTDGRGDVTMSKPVSEKFSEYNDPPEGFVFTDEKRVPEPGEWYLSKNGNAIQAKKVRGNNQTRHILLPE